MKILVIEIKVVQNSILYTTALSGDGCFPPQGRRFQTEKKNTLLYVGIISSIYKYNFQLPISLITP